MKTIVILASFLMLAFYSIAQDSTKKWQPSAGVHLTSVPTLHISGTDTSFQNALSIAPFLSVRNHAGFGVVYSPAFVAGDSYHGIYMHTVTIGIEQYDKKNFDFVADFSHFFFTSNSSIPNTPINNEIILESTFKKPWMRPRLSAGVGFGNDKSISSTATAYDIELAAGVSHSFEWNINNTGITLTPSLLINAGTNEYFSFLRLSKYISNNNKFNRVVKNYHARSARTSTGSQSTSTKTTQTISITNAELNLESSFEFSSFSLRPSGSLFVPVSSANSGTLEGYWEITATYNF